ncbi:hypothetical protein RHGRI_018715 [Rhododendron griersonianum]|uniref:Uncharacterized protein n=1 Tax=Rhododendron griersonianum TaxID=479676 RepID=A0AAV6K2S8_9ERIC|nr:hypothetical protein RHGRI_018715 [Rhododendron griersonianum]
MAINHSMDHSVTAASYLQEFPTVSIDSDSSLSSQCSLSSPSSLCPPHLCLSPRYNAAIWNQVGLVSLCLGVVGKHFEDIIVVLGDIAASFPDDIKKEKETKDRIQTSTERHANYGVSESHSNFRTGCGPAFAADIATGYGNSNVEGGNLRGQFGLYQRVNTDGRGKSRSYVSEIERHTRDIQ